MQFANLPQRVHRGGNLSRSERVTLQSMAASAGQVPAVAGDYSELARILGIARRTMNRWRKRPDAPQSAAGGFIDVSPWREFMQRNDLHGVAATTEVETALRARKLLAEVEERELRLAVKKDEYVALAEVRENWTKLASRVTDLLRNKFETELPPILSGLDATGIQAECCRAMDEVLTILHTGGGEMG